MNFCWLNHWINEINLWNTLNIWFGARKFWVQIFFHFCEKSYHQNLAKSFLRAQILTLEFSIVYPWKIGNFLYRMAYSKPENSNSNYSKSAFKECKELWRGLYFMSKHKQKEAEEHACKFFYSSKANLKSQYPMSSRINRRRNTTEHSILT